jgi:SecD/SecF fusion protein
VFDRIRENVPRMPRATFSQIVNRSMAEVLTRSLATTLSTLLPIIALLVFGGQTLKDFGFALLVGVASGAYSSIFIASPVLTHWKEREPVYVRRRQLALEDFGGVVPAYAPGTFSGDQDGGVVETPERAPEQRQRLGRAGRPSARPVRGTGPGDAPARAGTAVEEPPATEPAEPEEVEEIEEPTTRAEDTPDGNGADGADGADGQDRPSSTTSTTGPNQPRKKQQPQQRRRKRHGRR